MLIERRAKAHPMNSTLASRIVVLTGILLLAACASMDRNPAAPRQISAASLGAAETRVEWPKDDWWLRYTDPQLDQLVADGLAGNPSLDAARARVDRARAAAGLARAALLPQVSGNAEIVYQKHSENYIFPPP